MPTRMIRKQLYISEDQDRRLKQRALEQGRSEADIVRDCLDSSLNAVATRDDAWEREMQFIRARLTQNLPQRRRAWKREDLYEERLPANPRGH